MISEENRVMKHFVTFSMNVSSKSFETCYNFSERSMRIELIRVWLLNYNGSVASWQWFTSCDCKTAEEWATPILLWWKTWEKWCLGVVMGEGELYLLFFSPFLGKPEQWEWGKVRRGMFKIQRKGEPIHSKTLGTRRVWTAKFYVEIQKSLLQPPWKGIRRVVVHGDICSSSSVKPVFLWSSSEVDWESLSWSPDIFFCLEYFSHLVLAHALKIPSGWNFREVGKMDKSKNYPALKIYTSLQIYGYVDIVWISVSGHMPTI